MNAPSWCSHTPVVCSRAAVLGPSGVGGTSRSLRPSVILVPPTHDALPIFIEALFVFLSAACLNLTKAFPPGARPGARGCHWPSLHSTHLQSGATSLFFELPHLCIVLDLHLFSRRWGQTRRTRPQQALLQPTLSPQSSRGKIPSWCCAETRTPHALLIPVLRLPRMAVQDPP